MLRPYQPRPRNIPLDDPNSPLSPNRDQFMHFHQIPNTIVCPHAHVDQSQDGGDRHLREMTRGDRALSLSGLNLFCFKEEAIPAYLVF